VQRSLAELCLKIVMRAGAIRLRMAWRDHRICGGQVIAEMRTATGQDLVRWAAVKLHSLRRALGGPSLPRGAAAYLLVDRASSVTTS
jgi:hypothetical protein